MMSARFKHALDPQQLRVFAAVARHLNLRRAAAELELNASAASRALTALEQRWGCRLFERSSRRMAITPAGRELLPLADGVLERVRHLEERLQSGVFTPPGPLRIAAAPILARHILPLALREFRETCPDLALQVDLCASRDAVAGLLENRIDLALIVPPASLDGLTSQSLAEDDLHLVAHPLHPWAVARRAHLDAPGATRFILPDRRDSTRALIDEYLRADGVAIEPAMEIPGEDCIQRFVRLDLGVGILPRWVIAEEIERGQLTLLPLGRRRLRRTWAALHPRSRPLNFGEHLFANICGSILRDHIARHP